MEECKHLEAHEQRFCQIETEAKSKVSWTVFAWAVGIISAALFFNIEYASSIGGKVSNSEVEMAKIQTKLANIEVLLLEIKTDVKTHDAK